MVYAILFVLLITLLCKLQHNWAIKKRVRTRLHKYCME